MKKKHIFLITGILGILMAMVFCLLFVFVGLYGKTRPATEPQAQTEGSGDLVAYLKDNWSFHDGLWDRDTNTVTAVRTFDLTLEEGKKIGASVFTGDLSPESYLSQALTIAADLNTRFSTEDILVVISFRGNDDEELFSVDSIGNVSVCWDTEE